MNELNYLANVNISHEISPTPINKISIINLPSTSSDAKTGSKLISKIYLIKMLFLKAKVTIRNVDWPLSK
ncbi:CLUMA_CG016096, isoform A [Clunio marinus]|uniref:CLUMA_CG016096, isoform A n=1 Tax=Clunio marinus TaxID=568069 RepID=A0A1J1ISS0_9DIPT|nr:CLUMA_CG016096, isoform A [Clunio marinus]